MIASIRGPVEAAGRDHVIIEAGGLGYRVFVPFPTLARMIVGAETFLHTALILREDSISLYGFTTQAEREVFDSLMTVSGVGPKLALAVLSTMTLDNLRSAVASERADLLTRVPGVGKKTAQKIVIELRDRLKIGLEVGPIAEFDDLNSDVLDALIALGYSVVEAQTAIQALPHDAPPNLEDRVRLALQFFA